MDGWISHPKTPFILSEKDQTEKAKENVNNRLYEIIGPAGHGRTVRRPLRPDRGLHQEHRPDPHLSAKNGEGIPDLLLVLVGLAQRFLEAELKTEEGPAKGTILEVKEEKGLGQTVDVILYSGTLHRGDTVALGTRNKPLITKVKAILKPKPLDEIRDPRDKFDSVKEITAAAGVKVICQNLDGVVAGAPLRVIKGNEKEVLEEIAKETKVNIETADDGVMIKADAIGSLEALAFECSARPTSRYASTRSGTSPEGT